MRRLLSLTICAALLTGCSNDPAETRDNSGQQEAGGEVLGGSISDAMIPLETVRSQSPTLRAAPATTDEGGDGADAAGDEGTEPGEEVGPSQAEPQPAQPNEAEG